MSTQGTCGVDIFFPATGCVVEVRRPTTRADYSEHTGEGYVTLSLGDAEADISPGATEFNPHPDPSIGK